MTVFFFLLDAAGWHYGQILKHTDALYLQATSACLAPINRAPWLLAMACALLLCLLEDLHKALLRRANTKD